MRGLFSVDRGVFQNPLFKDEPYTEREAWIWLLSEAAYKKRDVRTKKGVAHLERGQLTHSSRFMAEKWKWKEPRVRRFLKRLKIDAAIDVVSDSAQNIITICNYDIYQDYDNYTDAISGAAIDAVPTQYRRKQEQKNNKSLIKDTIPREATDTTGVESKLEKQTREGAEAFEVLTEALELAGLQSQEPSDQRKWIRQVRGWLKAGAIPSLHIYPAIRREKARMKTKITSLGFFTEAIRAEINKPDPMEEEASLWRCRLTGWYEKSFWLGAWGEPPTSGRCMAPREILSEFKIELRETA